MLRSPRPCLALLCMALACIAARAAGAAPVPVEGATEPDIRKDDQGRTVVTDEAHGYRIRMPAPYWECKTPGQISAEAASQGGGCAGSSGTPPTLLLVLRHKDARAVVSLELLPDRFLMRGKEDLEGYVNGIQRILMERGGKGLEIEKSSYEERDGMIVHRTLFRADVQGERQKYLLVDFFVRPADEEARLYQMACYTSEAEYTSLSPEFDELVGGFEFIGTPAPSFFAPDAPLERLPSLERLQQRAPVCGGGSLGVMIGMILVFIAYLYFTRRRRQDAA